MTNTEPLRQYIESRDALKAGDKDKAVSLLSASLGGTTPSTYMVENLNVILEPNPAILTLILHESKKED